MDADVERTAKKQKMNQKVNGVTDVANLGMAASPAPWPSTVKMPSGGRIMLALTRSQRRVRAPGLQESGFIIPGGEPPVMATPLGRGGMDGSQTEGFGLWALGFGH
jgi:hypothetical protein